MKLAIMQPYVFPYIGYFQLINAVDKFVLFDDVSFIKKGWINRNRILVNKQEYTFTIPLKKASQNKLIKDIEISEENNWRDKFLKTIEKSYCNASFFKDVFDLIENIILTKENSIAGLNYYTIIEINKFLGINTEIVKTSSKYENNDIKGEERIIDICRIEKSEVYVNPIGGVDLYKKTKFDLNGISLKFIKSNELVYNQSDNSFIPDLSIIDVMMNNSRNSVKNYLNDYTLV